MLIRLFLQIKMLELMITMEAILESALLKQENIKTSQLTLTRAPITPRLVNRRYSNGRVLLTVCKNG